MKTTHLTATLLLSTALATPVLAQDSQPYALDEIVVYYGALEPRSADQTGQSVTVLSKADMERTGETRLANLIAKTAGRGDPCARSDGGADGLYHSWRVAELRQGSCGRH